MSKAKSDFTMLTPVPEQHLISGIDMSSQQGFVTFGSDAAMPWSELALHVDVDHPSDILIYASESVIKGEPCATYIARFVSYQGARGGKAPADIAKYRPVSTEADGAWQAFYVVSDLRKLEKPIPVSKLRGKDRKSNFAKNFIPIGPTLIDQPF